MTLWFSFQRYNLLNPAQHGFVGLDNYDYLLTDPGLWPGDLEHAPAGGRGR